MIICQTAKEKMSFCRPNPLPKFVQTAIMNYKSHFVHPMELVPVELDDYLVQLGALA